MFDVLVVGGGIIGTSVALHLVDEGLSVCLVDHRHPGNATDASAGISTPQTTLSSSHWFQLAMAAFEYLDDFSLRLTQIAGEDTGIERCGGLLVSLPPNDVWDEQVDELCRRSHSYGHQETLERLGPEEVGRLFPPIGAISGALYNPQARRIDGRTLTEIMRRISLTKGLVARSGSVERLIVDGSVVTGATIDGETIQARTTVISGGAWSSAFSRQLGYHIPVRAERGQIIHLQIDDPHVGSWPIINSTNGNYIVPWNHGKVVVGATHEPNVGDLAVATASGMHRVLQDALAVAPGLGEAVFKEVRVGMRPSSPDGLPIVGPVPRLSGVLLATGHGSTGLQLGPYTGRLVADLVLGQKPKVNVDAFSPTRFEGDVTLPLHPRNT